MRGDLEGAKGAVTSEDGALNEAASIDDLIRQLPSYSTVGSSREAGLGPPALERLTQIELGLRSSAADPCPCYDCGMRRGDFENLVRRYLDSELLPRGFRLTPQTPADWNDEKPAAVYEADPHDFAERYPALRRHPGSDVRCIDFWVHLDPSTGKITSELEGPSLETLMVRLGVMDPAETEPAPSDTDSQLRMLTRRIDAILDAASRG